MSTVLNDTPILIGGTTQAKVNEQGITYNQAGFSYNQIGIAYGGVYNVDQDVIPSISLAENIKPSLIGENTQAQVKEQGYTYNQPGFSYNQIGIMYGGIYNQDQDIIPILSLAENIVPTIYGYQDIYKQGGTITPPTGNSGMLIGPGLPWQFLTYP